MGSVFLEGFIGALGALLCVGIVLAALALFSLFLDKLYTWANRERDTEKPRRSEWSFARDSWNDEEENQ